jgi:hypothetical protein
MAHFYSVKMLNWSLRERIYFHVFTIYLTRLVWLVYFETFQCLQFTAGIREDRKPTWPWTREVDSSANWKCHGIPIGYWGELTFAFWYRADRLLGRLDLWVLISYRLVIGVTWPTGFDIMPILGRLDLRVLISYR